ncbi:MAG: DUF3047 domain-containing protein [Longimicrobiales bacterium]|nr:DUF3047 domain-containing protein [Longimicrobiales bacterium]
MRTLEAEGRGRGDSRVWALIRSPLGGLLLILGAASAVSGQSPSNPVFVESFDDGLEGWETQALDRQASEFQVVTADGDPSLAATSNDAAAALFLSLPTGPVDVSRLQWRWSVESSLTENARERESEGDDYAARILAVFGGTELSDDTRALAYVWAGQEPVGSRYRNPNLSQVETIVVQSGDRRAGRWVTEERLVSADYREAFGEPAPPLSALAIIVDTDDTDAAATAWFDDLRVWGRRAAPRP